MSDATEGTESPQLTAKLYFRSHVRRIDIGPCEVCDSLRPATSTAVFEALGTEATVTVCSDCKEELKQKYEKRVLDDE